jgi:small subunit ribosomal protein S3
LGRKVHPYGFRLGVIRDWRSRWYANVKDYPILLHEDRNIRGFVMRETGHAGVSHIDIERFPNQVSVTIWTAKPGIVIGRKGASVKVLRTTLEELTGKRVQVDVQEIAQPELDAKLVADNIVSQLERRISHTRAMKRAVQSAMRAGEQGIRIMCKGRLHGAEMARMQWVREGRVPLHTLRADIDYDQQQALTNYGRIGVKVWIYKGEVLPEVKPQEEPFVV